MEEAFSSIDQVAQCMSDEKRSLAFQDAILRQVKPHHTVLDVGTGTGLLAMFAAQAGARKIVSVELDPYVAATAKENIRQNNFTRQIEVVEADATNFGLPGMPPFDVVLMELLTTGMIDEVQVPAVNNLYRNNLIHDKTIFVPGRVVTYASLAQVNFELYGLDMKMVRHLWYDFPETHSTTELTERCVLHDFTFNIPIDPQQQRTLDFPVMAPGIVNALLLKTETFLAPGVSIWDTLTLNAPVVLPLEERLVGIGEKISMSLEYVFGSGYSNFHIQSEGGLSSGVRKFVGK